MQFRFCLPVLVSTTIAVTGAVADPVVMQDSDGWRYGVTAYLFAPVSTKGTSTVAGESADIDMNLQDALNVLDFALAGRFEAWNGDVGIIVDGNYLGISDKQSITLSGPLGKGLDVDVEVTQSWLALMGAWRIDSGVNNVGGRYSFDISGGIRANSLKQEIKLKGDNRGKTLGGTETWFEPVVGIRGAWGLSENWGVAALADAGGFGVGGNKLAWSATLGFAYQPWEKTAINFGYRYYSIDYETDRSDGTFAYDVQQHGPFIGLTYTFQ